MATVNKSVNEVPTIDVVLVTIDVQGTELGLDTSNKIGVEPQVETQDAVKLIIKGVLKAQKPELNTVTGNQITLTDNVFNPELAVILQGGIIEYDAIETTKAIKYTPPVIGSTDTGDTFSLSAYSAQYDTAGAIVQYEKVTYPNCKGKPIALSSEDGVFRAPEYVINSAPADGEAPYVIDYVAIADLPALTTV